MSAFDVVVVGAGPAGVVAALRAADLGARTALVTRDAFGGMAANDGPVPVRTLAHAARLLRETSQLARYGIDVGAPSLDYPRLLARVREVVAGVRRHSAYREQLVSAGATIHEHEGAVRLTGARTLVTATGRQLEADKIILCTGGKSRKLAIPGFEHTVTHSDAWSLEAVPASMLVIGGGATAVQVASIFHAFGSRVELFESGPRILRSEDEDVSAEVTAAFREDGILVHQAYGKIERFEKTKSGVRMIVSNGERRAAEASVVVAAVGWIADTEELDLAAAGVETDERGFVRVDASFRTSNVNVFAAGDVTGRLMLVPQAMHAGHAAATNAVRGSDATRSDEVAPIGSFTDPEYAQVGLTEAKARETNDVVVATARAEEMTRAIIDGRTRGFCKLIVDRATARVLGCHVVGDRAVDIVQLAAVAMAAKMPANELARVPFSFPTYAGILARAAATATRSVSFGR